MDADLFVSFLAAAVRVATPLLLAALGETLVERGGVINLSIEGAMLAGALGAAIGASLGGVWSGVAAAAAAGLAVALAFALVAIVAKADQIIAGTAITLCSIGLTGAIARQAFGAAGVGLSLPTLPPVPVPLLASVPVIGPPFFSQSVLTYTGYVLVPILWWVLFRSRWGLELRAAGESADKAQAAGVAVRLIRTQALLLGGALAGLAGASLVLAQVGTFAEKMTAGRGFIAIAIVALGSWHPGRVAGSALFFGAAMALQFLAQSFLPGVPYQLFLMLPYLLTLLVLAGAIGRAQPPEGLAQ
jgi:general nucleoside transport system permease protein